MSKPTTAQLLLRSIVRECTEQPVLYNELSVRVLALYEENRQSNKRLPKRDTTHVRQAVDDALTRAICQRAFVTRTQGTTETQWELILPAPCAVVVPL